MFYLRTGTYCGTRGSIYHVHSSIYRVMVGVADCSKCRVVAAATAAAATAAAGRLDEVSIVCSCRVAVL